MALAHETPLSDNNFHPSIGGSSGKGTHGEGIDRPADMPTKDEADYVVSSTNEFLNAVRENGAVVYVDDNIDMTGARNVRLGSGVQLVGGFCDPERTENGGRGPVITQDYYNPEQYDEPVARTLISKWGKAPTLWGISLKGPNTEYFDPRERVKSDEWDSSRPEDWYATGLWCYDDDEFTAIGCEFWGWSMAGVELGSRGHETEAVFERCSMHHCQMETLGYGVEQYNGTATFERCFFDCCRHAVSGFGYPGEEYTVFRSVAGPGPWCGHAFDMHSLDNNLHNGDNTAGGRVEIRNCSIMSTRDIRGYDQEGFAGRGIPAKEYRIENCQFWHLKKPTVPNKQGNAYRQETKRWRSFYVDGNTFGEDAVVEGVGAPLARTANEDADDTQTGPSKQPATEPMKLQIEGRGTNETDVPTHYRIRVRGTATTGKQANKGDRVRENDDGTVTIAGYVNRHAVTFGLGEGSILTSFRASNPVDVYLAGKKVDLAPLVASGAWQRPGGDDADTVAQLRQRLEQLVEKMNSIQIVFGGGK